MRRKAWFLAGFCFGVLTPFVLNVISHFSPWHSRPAVYLLFAPARFLLGSFAISDGGSGLVFLLLSIVNAALFGAVAVVLRKGFWVFLGGLLVLLYISLPPSDEKLERRFAERRPNFQRLIDKTTETPSLTKIGMSLARDLSGRDYYLGSKSALVSVESWNEYRRIFKKTEMTDGLTRNPGTGQIVFLGRTLPAKFGELAALYGYVYCPSPKEEKSTGFLPCVERKEGWDIGDYRYKRIAPDWYLIEVFRQRSLDN